MKVVKPCLVLMLYITCSCNTGKQQYLPGKKTVEVIHSGSTFQLYRNGQPYIIKGICVLNSTYLQQAKASGANSIRTYGTDNAADILEAAGKLGLTVTLGLKLPYADIEMNYRDDKAVALQVEKVRKEVMKYRNHPALLMWGIGNELSLYLKGSSILSHIALLRTIDKIAVMIHQTDPNHPTTTTLPFVRKQTISAMNMFCKNLDVLSINSFEELDGLPARAQHYSKPYIVSEYGANGYWLTAQTDWNTRIEQTSREKSAFVIAQSKIIKADSGRCLGSYAFIWGSKLEYTSSWFSLFSETGEATQVIDALQYTWTGKWPASKSPDIYSLTINNQKSADNIYLQPGKAFTAGITTGSSDIADLYVTSRLYRDDLEVAELYTQANYKQDTAFNLLPDTLPFRIVGTEVLEHGITNHRINIVLRAPETPGPYRLFVYLHNRRNKVATANACFYVHD